MRRIVCFVAIFLCFFIGTACCIHVDRQCAADNMRASVFDETVDRLIP